ncbi:MAG: flagellar hook protein FlgE [Bacteroidetes bacterium]|nr:flagellar hook protein FlgE [Bacteroidota bacterium]
MAFLRSLSAGVTGLRNHTLMMDVIGNNVANINTIGFKASRITFGEMFAQTLRGASGSTATTGGMNPLQIGLGASVLSVDMLFKQGGIEMTGKDSDLAVSGSGLFVVNKGGKNFYTRIGAFEKDASGNLVQNGAILQGKLADQFGNILSGTNLENLRIDADRKSPAKATTLAEFSGNLDPSAAAGTTSDSTVTVYDTQGNPISLSLRFTKQAAANEWTWTATVPPPATATAGSSGTISFNDNGSFKAMTYDTDTALKFTTGTGTLDMVIDLQFGKPGEFRGITQNKGSMAVSSRSQDGYTAGELSKWDIDSNGFINATFSNGQSIVLGQVMLAEFNNPNGLSRTGDGLFDVSANSGIPVILSAGEGSRSAIVAGSLEQSNVDLPEEFTKMIVAQRGFQSNARVITTSDEILNEVVNLKR